VAEDGVDLKLGPTLVSRRPPATRVVGFGPRPTGPRSVSSRWAVGDVVDGARRTNRSPDGARGREPAKGLPWTKRRFQRRVEHVERPGSTRQTSRPTTRAGADDLDRQAAGVGGKTSARPSTSNFGVS